MADPQLLEAPEDDKCGAGVDSHATGCHDEYDETTWPIELHAAPMTTVSGAGCHDEYDLTAEAAVDGR